MPLKVSPLIAAGMVVQQEAAIPVHGQAAPETEITVSFAGATCRTTAGSDGMWQLLLNSQSAGGPYTMEIAATGGDDDEKIVLDDIYVGDVWLCSGQSNMEMPMLRVKNNFPEEWQPPINALIRQFKVPQEWDFASPREELSGGCWKAAASQTLDEFSATAWFFARTLYEKYRTPIGLINAAWGGTPIEAWMSHEALAPFPAKIAASSRYADDAKRDEITRVGEAAIRTWENNAAAADRGLAEKWNQNTTDFSAWNDITLPDDFAAVGLTQFCGVIWLRREFEVSAEFAAGESRLWMGTIVDADTAYINGVEIGTTAYRYPPRKYTIPAGLLRAGKNQIVVRVICWNGEGGITKGNNFRVFSETGSIELGGTWKYRVGMTAQKRPEEFFFQRQPICLFNAMIAAVLKYPLKGVIWYQGESNDPNPHEYEQLFRLMIDDWRNKHTPPSPPLPFLLVQLPIFGEPEDNNESSSWAIIREAQAKALSLPATGMAAGLELGEWNDLHPVNKKGIGRRLALAAEKTVYRQPNTSPGPIARAIERRGGRLLITFDNCGKGLTVDGQLYVSVAAGGEVFRLPANIDGPDCISIDISNIENPEKILYAWANNPRDRQLYNSDGLPAIPYRLPLI